MDRAVTLMEQARKASSLDDFGEDTFREGLDVLLRSLDEEACLTQMGRAAMDAQIVDLLSQRLQIEDWYRRHPEIDEEEIVAPLVGLGLPRTGSTALSCMLAEDPAARTIRTWEANPVPPPEQATEHTDPRIERTRLALMTRDRFFPRMKMMLPSTPTSPTECNVFQAYDFKSHFFKSQAQVPGYSDWLNHSADLVPTYRYVKRVLKLLQWRCPPRRWRLKNPSHILFIDALDQVFPDARYWMTHRDVASVIPSVADLYYELNQAFSDDVDKHFLGRSSAESWELGMRRLIAFRDAGHDHRFFDVYFASFQRSPFPAIEGLYDFLGEEFTAETRKRMRAWRNETPREKHGDHVYDPAEYGLDNAVLRKRFHFYHERFGVLEAD